jgi:hypothetical protein
MVAQSPGASPMLAVLTTDGFTPNFQQTLKLQPDFKS